MEYLECFFKFFYFAYLALKQLAQLYSLFECELPAFDVDVLFLFPVAVAYNSPELGFRDFIEILIFVAILSLAIVYAWRKGMLEWV